MSPGWGHADLFGPIVAPEVRGQKLGTILLEASIERAEDRGAERRPRGGRRAQPDRTAPPRAGRLPPLRDCERDLPPRAGRASSGRQLAPRGSGCGAAPRAISRRPSSSIANASPAARSPRPPGARASRRGPCTSQSAEDRALAIVNIDPSDRWIYHLGVTESERSHGVGAYILSRATQDYWEQRPGEVPRPVGPRRQPARAPPLSAPGVRPAAGRRVLRASALALAPGDRSGHDGDDVPGRGRGAASARTRLPGGGAALSALRVGRARPRGVVGIGRSGPRPNALADAGIAASELQRIGLTNQRETTIVWDRSSGRPVHRAIVWQDRRTAERCKELPRELIRDRTGLLPDPYFSATKLEWILSKSATPPDLAFGTVDSWLLWKLSGGEVHATDVSNASRTLLFNLETLDWDPELLELFGVPDSVLPARRALERRRRGGRASLARRVPDRGRRRRPAGGALRAGLLRARARQRSTYGTGSFVLVNAGDETGGGSEGLVRTVAWRLGDAAAGLRARGLGLRHRSGAPVAPRRARDPRRRAAESEELAPLARGQRRRLLRPGADRARLSALDPGGTRR